jgi:hypothetical protein
MKAPRIIVDSGAYSAWQGGTEINLKEYISYCQRHKDEADVFVNLDYIPGENGIMDHSQAAIEASASRSFENLQIMKSEGIDPMPVFHQGERFYWLEKMLEEGETYIGIAPYKKDHPAEITKWLDKCFTILTNDKGMPLVKTHGLGVTACNQCIRFPWYSVDSTSWSIGGGHGSILVPHYVNGIPDYSRPPVTMRISARKQDQSKGFDGLTEIQQDIVRKAVADAGIAMSELRNTFMGRWKFNMCYYLGLEKACDGKLFKNRSNSLFNSFAPKGKGYKPEPLKMYFATVLHTRHHNSFLNDRNITKRLLSYAFLKDLPDDFLQMYRETGEPVYTAPRPRRMSVKMLSSEPYRVRRANSIRERIARTE